jgi:hypothetical protein
VDYEVFLVSRRRERWLPGFVPIRAIGLGLVLAVALDATVVRMLLVPATMTLLGWYGGWAPHPLRRVHSRFAGRFAEAPAGSAARPRARLGGDAPSPLVGLGPPLSRPRLAVQPLGKRRPVQPAANGLPRR